MSPFLHFVSSSSYWFKFTYHILISPVNERTPGQISISYTHRNLYSEQVRSKVLAKYIFGHFTTHKCLDKPITELPPCKHNQSVTYYQINRKFFDVDYFYGVSFPISGIRIIQFKGEFQLRCIFASICVFQCEFVSVCGVGYFSHILSYWIIILTNILLGNSTYFALLHTYIYIPINSCICSE